MLGGTNYQPFNVSQTHFFFSSFFDFVFYHPFTHRPNDSKTVQTIAFLAWLKYGKLPSGSSKASSANDEEEKEMDVEESDVEIIGEDSDDEHNDHDEEVATDKRRQASRSVSGNPHIVIVPASVLSNWEREIEKFCPSLKVVKYHGSMQEREDLRDEMRTKYLPSKSGKKAREKLDVVLTTFSYFSKEKSEDRSFLRRFHFDYMVVDEAHQLKNPKGLRYQNMDKFITSHRLLLTGKISIWFQFILLPSKYTCESAAAHSALLATSFAQLVNHLRRHPDPEFAQRINVTTVLLDASILEACCGI